MKKLLYLFAFLLVSSLVLSQESVKNVTLLWDSSFGMSQKDLGKELSFLDSYFGRYPEANVKLVVFSNATILDESYVIRNGDWNTLKTELTNTIYDGATSFDNIFSSNPDEYILVTDGKESIDALPIEANKPVNIICSVPNANIDGLRRLSVISGGVFINAANNADANAKKETKMATINGIVADLNGPLSQASIKVKGENKQSSTNNSGAFSITATVGSLLEFSHIGKQTQVRRVSGDDTMNIVLQEGNEELEAVLVTAEARQQINEEVVNTGNSRVEKRKLGYGIESISDEDISYQDINLETAIRGQFSNVDLLSDQNISEYVSRGRNMSILLDQTGLVIIDGVPVESNPNSISRTPNQALVSNGAPQVKNIMVKSSLLDPSNVESITVLKGLAATNKYGTLGRNGVILVTTKTASTRASNSKRKPVVLGTTATYTGDASSSKEHSNQPYIQALKKVNDINDAYSVYLRQREVYGDQPSFYFDVANYFSNWNNSYLVDRVLSNVAELDNANEENLMALAYKYDELGKAELSKNLYEKIVSDNPDKAQHYRNLALAYRSIGNFKGATNLYQNIDLGAIEELKGVSGIKKILAIEFNNLKARSQGKVLTSYSDPKMKTKDLYDKRVVFEWNAFDAEFELQIVNPQNRFYTWSHTREMDGQRIGVDMEEGSGLEEFFLTKEDVGQWLFNVTYLGKIKGNNKTPTYLKVTTYNNYGKANESQEVQVITLDEPSKKKTVLTVNI